MMRVAVFSTKPYDRQFLTVANYDHEHELIFLEPRLDQHTAMLAAAAPAVCLFVNDQADHLTLEILAARGTRILALRSAGFNHVDLKAAAALRMTVVRVPAYSPYAVAEHTVGLMLALNRKLYRAYNRVRDGNFALDGLMGFDFHGKTIGIIGTGKIGQVVAQILKGFGCRLLAYDLFHHPECEAIGVEYVPLAQLFASANVISLHCPLTPETYHLVNEAAIAQMKPNVMLINTSRGALIDTEAVIQGLKSERIGALGLDVYEQESDLFFENLSDQIIQDDVFARLMTFPNVLITGHQAFFTEDAMKNIAETTLENITAIEQGQPCGNEIHHNQQVITRST